MPEGRIEIFAAMNVRILKRRGIRGGIDSTPGRHLSRWCYPPTRPTVSHEVDTWISWESYESGAVLGARNERAHARLEDGCISATRATPATQNVALNPATEFVRRMPVA